MMKLRRIVTTENCFPVDTDVETNDDIAEYLVMKLYSSESGALKTKMDGDLQR
jgi:hypothetical protein